MENGASGLTALINVWDYDRQSTNFVLTATSLSNNLADISVTATNLASATNAIFTLTFAPVTNVSGVVPIHLVASEVSLTTNLVITYTTNSFSFVPASTNYAGAGDNTVIAADVNGDGKPDLITVDYDVSKLTVLTNNGSGGFVPASTNAMSPSVSLIAADVNGDGNLDLICVN